MNRRSKRKQGAARPLRFYINSLGCPKNTVDSTGMASLLLREGYLFTPDPGAADLLIVNTCGFIAPARSESLDVLETLASELRPHQKLVAAGCWAQREPELLLDTIPQLNAVLGTRAWASITSVARKLLAQRSRPPVVELGGGSVVMPEAVGVPGYAVLGPSAFLKIADGCSRSCAFCAIPLIKGPFISRSMEDVLADARELQELGVLELNLIAQDSTYYGYDLGQRDGLADLLERMVVEVPGVPWIRLLYTFPGYITPRLTQVLVEHAQILPYVDIPLQHAHPAVLRRMRRPSNMDWVRETVGQLRELIPNVVLRTTLIVGFPGETDAEFQTLLDFVEEMRFDRVGVFQYSHEPGTEAGLAVDDVPAAVKEARYDALMLAQQPISHEKNRALIGQQMDVLLEGFGDGLTVGRSYRDAPEIDGLVLLEGEYPVNQMVKVRIVDATVYDLIAELVT